MPFLLDYPCCKCPLDCSFITKLEVDLNVVKLHHCKHYHSHHVSRLLQYATIEAKSDLGWYQLHIEYIIQTLKH
jgi:hypothetical protein